MATTDFQITRKKKISGSMGDDEIEDVHRNERPSMHLHTNKWQLLMESYFIGIPIKNPLSLFGCIQWCDGNQCTVVCQFRIA